MPILLRCPVCGEKSVSLTGNCSSCGENISYYIRSCYYNLLWKVNRIVDRLIIWWLFDRRKTKKIEMNFYRFDYKRNKKFNNKSSISYFWENEKGFFIYALVFILFEIFLIVSYIKHACMDSSFEINSIGDFALMIFLIFYEIIVFSILYLVVTGFICALFSHKEEPLENDSSGSDGRGCRFNPFELDRIKKELEVNEGKYDREIRDKIRPYINSELDIDYDRMREDDIAYRDIWP